MKKHIGNHNIIFDYSGIGVKELQEKNNLPNDSLGKIQAFNLLILEIKKKISLGESIKVNPSFLSKTRLQKIIDLGEKLSLPCYYNQKQSFDDLIQNSCNPIDLDCVLQKINHNTFFESLKSLGFSGISAMSDIHGNHDKMYEAVKWAQKNNHFIIFLGDLFNHGNQNFKVLDLAYQLIIKNEAALCRGNHDVQFFYNIVINNKKRHSYNLPTSLSSILQYNKLSFFEKYRVRNQLSTIINRGRWWWKANNYVFAHAAWSPKFLAEESNEDVERISIFGYSKKINNEWVQCHEWIEKIPKDITVVVGHECVSKEFPKEFINANGGKAIFLDTGCSKKGFLSTIDLIFDRDHLRFRNFNRF